MKDYIVNYRKSNPGDQPVVESKSAFLSDTFKYLDQKDNRELHGFFITIKAYKDFLNYNNIENQIRLILEDLDSKNYSNLSFIGQRVRQLILGADIPYKLQVAVIAACEELSEITDSKFNLVINGMATDKSLMIIDFGRQPVNYLNIKTKEQLLKACINCYVSLFTDQAIRYKEENGLDQMGVGMTIGVQMMNLRQKN